MRHRRGKKQRQQRGRYSAAMTGYRGMGEDGDEEEEEEDATTITTNRVLLEDGLVDTQAEAEEGEEESEVWKQYRCKSIPFGKEHPGSVVEGAALAAIDLPPNVYPLQEGLRYQIENGLLSSMQLEGVMYACERHSRKLPDGQRAGFLLNDSAGVGKGRQVAGIILDNLVRGRAKHVWFSVSKDLHLDASRDFRDLCCTVQVVESVAKLEREVTSPLGCVVFCTYTELISKGKRKSNETRYDELVQWLCGGKTPAHRKAFTGCLIFDESHKAKNVIEGKADNAAASSKTGELVVRIQQELPNARVVYSSATGVSGIESMGYLVRMGLWGPKTAFKTFGEFYECFGGSSRGGSGGGFGSLEMLALNFKASGCSVARSVGYYGATFDTVHANLTKETALMYRQAVVWMYDLLQAIVECKKLCDVTPENNYRSPVPGASQASTRFMSMYWAFHLRFMRQLINGIKVPVLVQVAEQAIREGHCVVIGLQTTNESCLKQYVEEGGPQDFPQVLSSCKLIMRQFINKWFPVKQSWQREASDPLELSYRIDKRDLVHELALLCKNVDQLDPNMLIPKVFAYVYEEPIAVPAYRADGTVVPCEVMRYNLLARLDNLNLPPSALDDLVDRLGGPSRVAEMTGRSVRQVRCSKTGKLHIEKRLKDASMENSLNVQEQRAFQHGHKLIAIISEAASTGISLHADKSKPNQRRRVHCTLELPWQAQQAIQQLGRSHRTNQLSAPMFKLVSSGLGGEHRFLSSISKRLQSLGALTQGNRKASLGSLSFGEFQYESVHGTRALKALYQTIISRDFPANSVSFAKLVQGAREQVELDSSPELAGREKWCAPPARGAREIKTPEEFFDLMQEPLCLIGGFELETTTISEDMERERIARAAAQARAKLERAQPPVITLDGAEGEEEDEAASVRNSIPSKIHLILRTKDGKKAGAGVNADVTRFFNRILGLPLCQQSLLFNYFSLLLEADIKDAKQRGKYDGGLQTLDATMITTTMPDELLFRNPTTGDKLVLHSLLKDRGVSLCAALREVEYRLALAGNPQAKRADFPVPSALPSQDDFTALLARSPGNINFFRSREKMFGRNRVCLAVRIAPDLFAIIRPATGVASPSQMVQTALQSRYRVVPKLAEVQELWDEEYASKDCFHGPNCRNAATCTIGRRKQELFILSGNVISFWKELHSLAKSYTNKELCIVQTNVTETGQRIVGVLLEFPVPHLRARVKHLREQMDLEKRSVSVQVPVLSFTPAYSIWSPLDSVMSHSHEGGGNGYVKSNEEQLKHFGFSWNRLNHDICVVQTSTLPQVLPGYRFYSVSGRTVTNGVMRNWFMTSPHTALDAERVTRNCIFLRPKSRQDELDESSEANVGLTVEDPSPVVPTLLQALVVPRDNTAAEEEEEEEVGEYATAVAAAPVQIAEEVVYIDSSDEDGVEEEEPLPVATTTTTTTTTARRAAKKEEVIVMDDDSDEDFEVGASLKRTLTQASAPAPPRASTRPSRVAAKISFVDYYDDGEDSNHAAAVETAVHSGSGKRKKTKAEEEEFEDMVFENHDEDEEEEIDEESAKRLRLLTEEEM